MGRGARGDCAAIPARAARRLPSRTAGRESQRIWSDALIRSELELYLEVRVPEPGREHYFPTSKELAAVGLDNLRGAIRDHGGAAYWAAQLDCELDPRQERTPYSEADALAEARVVVAALGYLPGSNQIRRDFGLHRLASLLRRNGGAKVFAEKHRLSVREGQGF